MKLYYIKPIDIRDMSRDIRFPTMWYVQLAKHQISLRIRADYFISVELLTEHRLEFLSLKGNLTGSSESTLVKMPHCWKSHVTAHISLKCEWTMMMDIWLDMRCQIIAILAQV